MDFEVLLKEKLKDPEFKKGYKRAEKKLKLENHFNDLLQAMGVKEFFVEVKNISDY